MSSGAPISDSGDEPNTEDCMKALTSTSATGLQSIIDTVKASGEFVRFCIVECYKIIVKTINVGSSQVDEVIAEGKASSPMSTLKEGSKLVTCFFRCLNKIANAVKTGAAGIFNTASSGYNAGATVLQTVRSPANTLG